jgi:RNA polymerase sigma-70 factor (ECF subfamily)
MEWTQSLELTAIPAEADANPAAEAPWPQTRAEFSALVDAVQHELVHFAYCRLHNLPDAEDVVQDVLVQAYAAREKFRGVLRVRPYLYKMVANRCIDQLRKRQRSGPALDESYAAGLAAPPATGEHEEEARQLRQIEDLIGRLPADQAEVMRLRVFAGLPFASIAAVMGARVPTIKSRFRYGVERLRSILIPKEAKR